MKLKKVPVEVQWIGKIVTNLPNGNRFSTVSKFPEDKDWLKEAWSIVLEFDIPPKQQGNPSKAVAHFLVENAPHERLSKGKKFELYDGPTLMARVIVNG